jgi:hypothetical protein
MAENKTAINYKKRVNENYDEFNIKGKVFCHTTDNEATMKAAFTREKRNG